MFGRGKASSSNDGLGMTSRRYCRNNIDWPTADKRAEDVIARLSGRSPRRAVFFKLWLTCCLTGQANALAQRGRCRKCGGGAFFEVNGWIGCDMHTSRWSLDIRMPQFPGNYKSCRRKHSIFSGGMPSLLIQHSATNLRSRSRLTVASSSNKCECCFAHKEISSTSSDSMDEVVLVTTSSLLLVVIFAAAV